jgi:hypothetical protein
MPTEDSGPSSPPRSASSSKYTQNEVFAMGTCHIEILDESTSRSPTVAMGRQVRFARVLPRAELLPAAGTASTQTTPVPNPPCCGSLPAPVNARSGGTLK